ncbi:tyrosine-type recombinase/integrase [Roseomonas sp. CCTCC AB2023176]|uniref:tyrosine-type recombinase/integrase n=1 Tax=Roseomonas sp. CCTCC AB2023176 TaxID=3342640 RepID=UPI0035DF331D
MPRKVSEHRLDTRAVRRALKQRPKPYFRVVRRGALPLHLGFYKQADGRPGTWIGRRYLGAEKYETQALGIADDDPRTEADGVRVLTFDQAVAACTAWADGRLAAERAAAAVVSSPTVRAAVEDYIAFRKARSATSGRDAGFSLTHHVLSSPLADVPLAALTEEALTTWREGLRRGGKGVSSDHPPALSRATLARVLNDLRAALTATARRTRLPGDVLTAIREGLRAPSAPDRAREAQVLPDADVRRLVEASLALDPDFGALVLVMAATGCRFDQAARMTVGDLQAGNGRLMVPMARKGRGTKAQTHAARPLPDDVVARLRPLVAGRKAGDPLLTRWHNRKVTGTGTIGWERDGRRAWRGAEEMQRPWRLALVKAELPGDLVPYSLRHSSIVRGLKAGLPVRLVAAAHDTSVAMIEKHYGAFIVDAAEELLRRAAVPLV